MTRAYSDPEMQKMYDRVLHLVETGELHTSTGEQRRGTPIACAFWDGFNGMKRTPNAVPRTLSYAAFQAGQDWRKMIRGN